ncbi:RNAse Ccr4p [Cryptosporidium canis]|uniref:RNAse Ccr4p n=1 Tax=Cryptosporidium canis TaxID=195482 RepID=A0ABQ8P788_9CRYT|nr:RNAse Ccr4p [Cryptosporidium canis]
MQVKLVDLDSGFVIFTEGISNQSIAIKCIIQVNKNIESFLLKFIEPKVKNDCSNKILVTMNRNRSEEIDAFSKRLSLNLNKHLKNYLKERFNGSLDMDTKIEIQDKDNNSYKDAKLEDIINNESLVFAKISIIVNDKECKELYCPLKKNIPLVDSVSIKNEIRWGLPIVPNIIFTNGCLSDFSYKWYLSNCPTDQKKKHEILPEIPKYSIEIDQNYICEFNIKRIEKENDININDDTKNYSLLFRITLNSEVSPLFDTIYRFNHINESIEFGWREDRILIFNRDLELSPELRTNRLKIVTFNILSEIYALTDKALNEMYINCPKYALNSNYRRSLLARELFDLDADVICLQEVQPCLYESFINVLMGFKGYSSVFHKEYASVSTFFKKEQFRILESETKLFREILITDYPDIYKEIGTKWPMFFESLLDRISTVFQITILENKTTGAIFIFANTHLYYHPFGGHIRILQSKLLMDYVDIYLQKFRSEFPSRDIFPFILGDFNTLGISDARTLLTTGRIASDSTEWSHSMFLKHRQKDKNSEKEQRENAKSDGKNSCNILESNNTGFDFNINNKCVDLLDIKLDEKFKNVHINFKQSNIRVKHADSKGFDCNLYYPFTNKVEKFSGQLDYIYLVEEDGFFEKYNIYLNNYLPYVDEQMLKPVDTLPSPQYPSDHISVGIDISITKNKNGQNL